MQTWLKRAKPAQPQAKVLCRHISLVPAARSSSGGTPTAPNQRAGPSNTGAFFRTVSRPELALNAGTPIGHTPWGRRRLEGRETGGGEKGARPFPCPLLAPTAASCVVTMQIAAIAEINKGVGRRERDCESIATSAKSRTIQSTQGKTRENLRTSQPGLDRFQKRRERLWERQRARIAIAKASWFGVKKKNSPRSLQLANSLKKSLPGFQRFQVYLDVFFNAKKGGQLMKQFVWTF